MKTLKQTLMMMLFSASVIFSANAQTGYKIGDKTTDFKLKNVDGKIVSLADYKKAKGFIVVFTCNHCPFAKAYEQRIIALHRKYEALGYPVIAINPNDAEKVPDDSYENMQKRAKEKQYPFAYLYDETQATAKAYGATRTPHVYLLQKEGKEYVVKYIGAIDDNSEGADAVKEKYVEAAIEALNSGKAIATTQTKAIGCTIKWKK